MVIRDVITEEERHILAKHIIVCHGILGRQYQPQVLILDRNLITVLMSDCERLKQSGPQFVEDTPAATDYLRMLHVTFLKGISCMLETTRSVTTQER